MTDKDEIVIPADPEEQNDDRAEWARLSVESFQQVTGLGEEDGMDTAIGDLLGDLAHLCDRVGLSMEALLLHAKFHYDEETNPDYYGEEDDHESGASVAKGPQGTQFDFLGEEEN